MKIAITGHSRGIGAAITEQLKSHDIIGLSRSNGYNITDVDSIVEAVCECDVFINNAFFEDYQTKLLAAVHKKWQDQDKTIVNIGSIVTAYPRIEQYLDVENQPWPYRDYKQGLEQEFRRLAWQKQKCKLVLVNPGATDTDMIRHLDAVKLDPAEIAKTVDLVLNNPYIKEITVYAK